jgi:hypothetical protein
VATDLGYVVLIGFGSMKLTEFYKEITRRLGLHQNAWWKTMVNLVLCALLVLIIPDQSDNIRVLIALGAAGVAGLIHAGDTMLRSYRDELVSEVMSRTPGRSRRR